MLMVFPTTDPVHALKLPVSVIFNKYDVGNVYWLKLVPAIGNNGIPLTFPVFVLGVTTFEIMVLLFQL